MNLASQGDSSNLLFINFNQDSTSLAVGTKCGYRLFSLNSIEKLESIYDNDCEDINIVERLFSSSLVAIVSLSSPRKLKVCHFKKGTEICNYSYSNTILGVRLNRQRLVVCLEESLYIHNIRDMKVLHTIRDTPSNPQGLCALSVSNENCYLAYPGSNRIGEVQIFDAVNLRAVTMIPAHDNPLAAMTFNQSGNRLATASEKGTVIRVFVIPEGAKLFELRRGMKRCVTIYSLAFSPDSAFLCASSNTETVHIFRLEIPKERPKEDDQSWMGYFNQALKSSASYLPSQVTEILNQDRAFATARLPFCGLKNVCAWAQIQKLPRLLVASQDGYLYVYNVNPSEGGECTLAKQHRVDGQQDLSSPFDPDQQQPDRPLTAGTTIGSGTYAGTVKQRHDSAAAGTSSPGKHALDEIKCCSSVSAPCKATSIDSTYAAITRPPNYQERRLSVSEELGACTEDDYPPDDNVPRLDDDSEFPPMTHKTE